MAALSVRALLDNRRNQTPSVRSLFHKKVLLWNRRAPPCTVLAGRYYAMSYTVVFGCVLMSLGGLSHRSHTQKHQRDLKIRLLLLTPATKFGRDYMIRAKDLKLAENRKVGRPKKAE